MRNRDQRKHDYELVQRCLTGDKDALRQLYAEQQPCLKAALHRQLGPGRRNAQQVEDAAALVWIWLVEADYHRLRAYDPARGQLSTLVGAVSRQVLHYLRRAQRARLPLALRRPWAGDLIGREASAPLPEAIWEDLVASLTPQERRCLDEHLGTAATGTPPLTPTNRRALRMRLRRKVRRTIEDD